jgi:hypothetical protein
MQSARVKPNPEDGLTAIRFELGLSDENAEALFSDPLIARLGGDDNPVRPMFQDYWYYASCFWEDVFVGAFLIIDFSPYEKEVHVFLQRKAAPIAPILFQHGIWSLFQDPLTQRITGWVPEFLPDSIHKNESRLGFKIEGRKRAAGRRNGIPYDIILMGLTREDWEARQPTA